MDLAFTEVCNKRMLPCKSWNKNLDCGSLSPFWSVNFTPTLNDQIN